MRPFNIKYILFIINTLGLLLSSSMITGVVSDSETGDPLLGANVFIVDTDKGSATDVSGAYLISGIRACSTCNYEVKVLYIGYTEVSKNILINTDNEEYTLNLSMSPSSLEVETTTVTAKKRQDKITDAPAAIELVSAKDIKREESTNLGSYLKGLKGVDFTSSGVNNYSISVRGFNSSFTSRLLTLTDGRVANIPALRVINYSTVPQSSKDIESIEVVLGPSTALYGANAHSGVVSITSKSPATSEGLDISISGSAADERDLYKFSSRWAHKINDKLSFKLSGEYIQAYEWEFISEEEYKRHKYPWSGNPGRMRDGKDNNPWGFTTHYWESSAIKDTTYRNYYTGNDGFEYDVYVDDESECRTIEGYECELIEKFIGDGEPNDTGDPDGDGIMGEDWYNGYDDDNDGLIDEDYFYADGIDNDGDCPGDTNGDGISCGPGDDNVDEEIDWTSDRWIDGVDNNGNGEVDESEERYSNNASKFNLPDWQYAMEFSDIIIHNGRQLNSFTDKYGNSSYNPWYNQNDPHIRGTHIYDEENTELLFDVFIYDYGQDGIPGDSYWDDAEGDTFFTPWEGGNYYSPSNSLISSEGCGLPHCTSDDINYDFWNETLFDCGLDGECPTLLVNTDPDCTFFCDQEEIPNPDWNGADLGEGNGVWDNFDWNGDNQYTNGDFWESNSWSDNGDGNPDENEVNWTDNYPYANGVWDEGEEIFDYGQDGIPGTNDPGENDGLFVLIDQEELNGILDTGDGCYGCFNAEPFTDCDNISGLCEGDQGWDSVTMGNGRYDNGEPYEDTNGDKIYTPGDFKENFLDVDDVNGDGYLDYPDFEVKNSRTEFRLDYDPSKDLNITLQTGYSLSKLQQVAGIGRYLADNYEYTYYQLRGRYKNWFTQFYFNQGNSGETRGYLLGDMIRDESQNMAFQLQNNIKFRNTKLVWGIDYFRTEAFTNGSILNDGPNGYDNDGDSWFTSKDNIDNDQDSNDFSDWGIDGIGPYLITCGLDDLCPWDEGYVEADFGEGNLILDDCDNCESIVTNQAQGATYDSTYDLWFIDEPDENGNYNGIWDTGNDQYPYIPNPWYEGPDLGEGNGVPDFGEPGVNEDGYVIVDYLDNDCDGCDFDGDGYPNYQELQLNTNIYDPTDYPSAVGPESDIEGFDELIDENWCGEVEYQPYVPDSQYSGNRDGKLWRCAEGIDEPDEYDQIISNEMGFYFQTKTIPRKNKKFEIITAARFDHHDQLEEGIQFSPKFGIFYKPSNFQTFRLTYGKAFNTPSALTMATDLFVGKRGIVDYYLRGNRDGTPYQRVGNEFITSVPTVNIGGNQYNIINITGSGDATYWDGYQDRVKGAPYFLGFNTEFSDVPEFMPLDTSLYTIYVPELADSGRIYSVAETMDLQDVSPIKTEKIQTLEIGFKGFLSKRIHATLDYYVSLYEDFFSSPTVITPLVIRRQFSGGQDVTSFDNLDVVGMLPSNYNGGNAPFATQWDGRDNDNDWNCVITDPDCFAYGYGYLEDADDTTPSFYNNDNSNMGGLNIHDIFGWTGHEEFYIDDNDNGMYDYGEFYEDEDLSGTWNCIGCSGEWGYVDWITVAGGDTLGFTIHHPEDVINTNEAIQNGAINFGANDDVARNWIPVGVDEYSPINGLSEAEMITSPLIDAYGNPVVAPGFAYTPLHSVLAPMNYGEIWMQGLDVGLTYLIPESNLALDANFSFYKTTEYYNILTRKNDPINAPKFKMNASINWQAPIGNISIKYRHVDRFDWKDGIWSGVIGPYDLIDIHYNYKINKHLEFNITGLNVFDDRHKEMIGGAVMGRQIILRMSTSI